MSSSMELERYLIASLPHFESIFVLRVYFILRIWICNHGSLLSKPRFPLIFHLP